jgi:hypothetical protein
MLLMVLNCWERFCNWIKWGDMPQSERSLMSDLAKLGVGDIVENKV